MTDPEPFGGGPRWAYDAASRVGDLLAIGAVDTWWLALAVLSRAQVSDADADERVRTLQSLFGGEHGCVAVLRIESYQQPPGVT